ncbi:hypothetical protein A1O7_09441 [Cladophialophora yegresii CBS 114405]|uniref:Uncharacterized protein n=1 Tax=Cladophialophora yegresii CBS 114405 TaxID=1182544 RepID=W9W6B9_9EURO|nr:uncharacterized protein A1O7_09441 [Cladophialophora yegresii CBS 114405]EXJ54104.1 hypothetical protein A1O7_09441 [Cladophialophora yegresii CBS 114405]
MDQYKRQRYRSASIHSTADGVVHHSSAQDSAPDTDVQSSMQIEPHRPETPDSDADAGRLEDPAENENVHQAQQSSPDSHLSHEHHDADQSPDCHINSPLNRCPTFVRRQAQSLLPRRSISAGKQSPTLSKEQGAMTQGAMSTPTLPSSPPTRKRARLQRRV